jgi:protein-disulfide isomerase
MKLFPVILLFLLSFNLFAQKTGDILATANGQNYTTADLATEARQEFENLPKLIANIRQSLLEQQISDILFEAEAAAQKITVEKLIEKEVKSKVPVPTEKDIKAVYDANRAAIGDKTLEEIRPQIIAFLRREPEQKVYAEYISNLKVKYKATLGKDVNAANLSRFEILATVANRQISAENFEAKNKIMLAEIEADVYEHARESLEQTVYSNLLIAEAKAQGIDAGALIGREITDKMKEFSDEERAGLETVLREKLFKKYNAKFLLKEIPPIAQNISTDDDPAQGKTAAPVTVVMFTDFQCPACAATHPVLKRVLADYGDKVRFVVRDFPLVTIHENAFQAAVAAGAANAQGMFYEYTEVLYKNQNALDATSLKKYAADLGLNVKQFEADLANPKIADEVRKDIEDGKRYGISGTPAIFVNGVKVRAFSPEGFRKTIDKAMRLTTRQ